MKKYFHVLLLGLCFSPGVIWGATIDEEILTDLVQTETIDLASEPIPEPEMAPEKPVEESALEAETPVENTADATLQNTGMTLQSDPSSPKAEAAKNDPLKTLASAQGQYDVDLFSGSPSYSFPITLPPGRDGVTPKVSLHYSGNNRKFDSLAGYGWNLTQNAIYRSTNHGVDKIYDRNDFTAELNGQAQELVLIDAANQIYGAKTESSFTKYQFLNNSWIATDTKGTKYVFGSFSGSQQFDPNDTSKIYKWSLERVEDLNGNYITFTYFKDGGQIYPESIRYTGHGDELGIGEVKFLRIDRPAYSSYERGFKVMTRYLINSIETYTYHDGGIKRVLEYDFDHEVRNNAVQHLTKIEMKSPDGSFPPTEFGYFDGTESTSDKKINLLKQIRHPYGAVQDFTYRASTAFRSGGDLSNKIPFVIHTLYTDTITPDIGSDAQVTKYEYYGGHYFYDWMDAYKKEYAGFNEVIATDPEGNITKHYYHQSENSVDGSAQGEFADHIAKKGREYRTEVYDDSNNLYELSIQKWEHNVLPNEDAERDRNFLFASRSVKASYDGDADYRVTASESDYDDWGNVVTSRDFGEVTLDNQAGDFTDIGEDRIDQTVQYTQNAEKYLYGFSTQSETKDFYGNVIGREMRYYDQLPFGEVAFGNLTQKDQLLNSSGDILTTKIEYDEHGLPIKFINPRGFASTVTYDSHQFFPHSMTNALGQTVWYTYDMRFGIQNSFTDANGSATATTYDDFGRAIETRITDPDNVTQEVTSKTITYDLNAIPANITETAFTGQSGIEITSRTYLDGLGRTKQTRVEAEDGKFIVANQIYDKRGKVSKQFLPVFETGIEYSPINKSALGTLMTYDTLGRVTKTETPIGISEKIYDQWAETTIDPNGNKKDHLKNARGSLVQVNEYLDDVFYSTKYTYNPLNYLIKITDALGNIRSMTYDLLGRKLTDEDLHAVGDTTFGIRNYEYDANGNLVKSTDAKSNVVTYIYDDMDRMVSEDFSGEAGIETSYVYDQGNYGIGRLSSVTTKDLQKTFTYDVHGKVLEQKYLLDGAAFVFNFSYDWMGNPLSITYPDGKVVMYEYNSAGIVDSIKNMNNYIVQNIDYTPTGAVAKIEFANGTVTTQTFDPVQMYRLGHKVTVKDDTRLQDLSYNYDAVGNVMSIVDVSDTATAKTSTYMYDDLYRMIEVNVSGSLSGGNYTRMYGYNIIGNLLSRSDIGDWQYAGITSPDSTYSTPHGVTSAGGRDFVYDKNGNITSDGNFTHTWDFKNRLQSSNDGTDTTLYFYDESTTRFKKKNMTTGGSTYYLGKFYDLDEGVGKAHIYLGDLKVGTVKTEL